MNQFRKIFERLFRICISRIVEIGRPDPTGMKTMHVSHRLNTFIRRKLRLREGNAKWHNLKNLHVKNFAAGVYLSEAQNPAPPRTPPPPTHTHTV